MMPRDSSKPRLVLCTNATIPLICMLILPLLLVWEREPRSSAPWRLFRETSP